MKIRISGNTLRLRLSRSEVARLEQDSRVEDATDFGQDCKLTYSLAISDSSPDVTATLKSTSIEVKIPRALAQSWISTDSLTISTQQNSPSRKPLQITIEKDLKCLHKDAAENEDAYPNPLFNNLA